MAEGRTSYERGCVVGERYVLTRLIGRGGMGSVWVAWDHTLQVEVAFKALHGGAEGEKAEERLLREARAAALLRHPAIVRVFDFGVHGGRDPYIVMELLEGESMGAWLGREGPLGAVRALRLLLPIIDGLDVAHRAGVVHRDLKPDNFVLARDERGRVFPKVVDFGVAKLDRGSTTIKLTKGGSLLGTPEYMAPEQARGEDGADARTDVWALCASLYELISGRLPFTGANYNAVLRAILETEPAPLGPEAGVDAALWQVLARGLRKDPCERWPSMRALGEAIARWLLGQGVSEDACGASLHAMWLDEAEASTLLRPPSGSSPRLFSPEAPTLGAPGGVEGAPGDVPAREAAPARPPAPDVKALRAHEPPPGVGPMRAFDGSTPMLPTSVALPDEAIVRPRWSPRRVAFTVFGSFAAAAALVAWQVTVRLAPAPASAALATVALAAPAPLPPPAATAAIAPALAAAAEPAPSPAAAAEPAPSLATTAGLAPSLATTAGLAPSLATTAGPAPSLATTAGPAPSPTAGPAPSPVAAAGPPMPEAASASAPAAAPPRRAPPAGSGKAAKPAAPGAAPGAKIGKRRAWF
ncbi:MAG TPA: protein kinase [Polyangiaceae bacterium]|nr:protein kinase [Polyangiaceae bacterium]